MADASPLKQSSRMGLLIRLGKAGGRALVAHVVPDSLIPTWKLKKSAPSGSAQLKQAARLTGSKKKKAPSLKPYKSAALTAAGVGRPKPKAPKQKFDKNGWSMGRTLPAGNGSANSPLPSGSASLRRKLLDAARNPRALAQMKLDEMHHEYVSKKAAFLSKVKFW